MSFQCDLGAKFIYALANGLVKHRFYGDESITPTMLQEQIFSSSKMGAEQQLALITTYDKLLEQAARENWTSQDLEKYLKTTDITNEHVNAFGRLWNGEHEKIHQTVVASTIWNKQLADVSWRIDLQTSSRHVSELNKPIALMEMRVNATNGDRDVIRFEMDSDAVSNVMQEINAIEGLVSKNVAS